MVRVMYTGELDEAFSPSLWAGPGLATGICELISGQETSLSLLVFQINKITKNKNPHILPDFLLCFGLLACFFFLTPDPLSPGR